ncbi:hypothetical protein K4K57_012999 [Colletotrichum sp. SAR 10_99]|nr:hypothetical protein K4K55_001617 [Colletotrichum sp. SAR 10_96]KAJ5015543.1 hypothetical protein K4K57_012999 [Colletotrichum sp. SAR 10_99]
MPIGSTPLRAEPDLYGQDQISTRSDYHAPQQFQPLLIIHFNSLAGFDVTVELYLLTLPSLDQKSEDVPRTLQTLEPLKFTSNGFFGRGTETAYRDLSKLCQKILTAITICILDNECINAEHCAKMTNKRRLSAIIEQVTKSHNASESRENSGDSEIQAMYHLVDYISAVMARMVVQTSPSYHWQKNVLSVLIKRVTKIKVLLINLHESATIAINAGQGGLSEMHESWPPTSVDMDEIDEEEECEEYLRMVEASEKEGTASLEDKQIASHCVKQSKFRFGLNSAMRYILTSMRFVNLSGLPATTFEICAVAYETGFEGFKALLFQDRDLEYSATSDLDNMNTAHSAFNILNHTVESLNEDQDNRDDEESSDYLRTKLEWEYCGSESDAHDAANVDLGREKRSLCLNLMDEIITVMVPLTTTSPIFVTDFTNFRHVMAMTGFIRDEVQPYEEGQFSAFFRMYTNPFDADNGKRDVLPLSEAIDSGFFSRASLVAGSDNNAKRTMQELEKRTKYMDEWVVDENYVTVQCGCQRKYKD